MAEVSVIVNPFVVYECPDCSTRTATNAPDVFPDCPQCGLPGEALEFVGLAEVVMQGSPEHKALESWRASWAFGELVRQTEGRGGDDVDR